MMWNRNNEYEHATEAYHLTQKIHYTAIHNFVV